MATGKIPFHEAEAPVAVLLRHVNDPPPPPQSLNPDNSTPSFCAWLERMLRQTAGGAVRQGAVEAWEALEEIILRLARSTVAP